MSGKMARNKGQRAEREVCKLLEGAIEDVLENWDFGILGEDERIRARQNLESLSCKRNLQQTQNGGFDIAGIEWLALEVKHQESFAINSWWKQTCAQSTAGEIPVLLYRRNRIPWRCRMFAQLPVLWGSGKSVNAVVDISKEDFLLWFKHELFNRAVRSL